MSHERGIADRVLMISSSVRDQEIVLKMLHEDGQTIEFCKSVAQLEVEMQRGCSVVILPADIRRRENASPLLDFLRQQPEWSDLPVIFILAPDDEHVAELYEWGNVTILQRPLHIVTFITAVRASLASRRKQFQLRDLLDQERKTKEILRNADTRKNEFLATLAHELRNPLSPIANGIELLHRSDGNEDLQRQLIPIMSRQVRQLVRLIDDIMDVSRITRGKFVIKKVTFDFLESITAAVDAVRPFLEESAQTLNLDLPSHPVWVNGDSARLAQSVTNVLNNAAKYTPKGGTIEVKVEAEYGKTATIRVRDNGIGIDPEVIGSVFEIFQQHDVERQRGQAGLGIGLSLVKRLIELHDGTIDISSPGRDRGTTVTIRLPLAARMETSRLEQDLVDETNSSSLKTLIVEDVRAIRQVLGQLVASMGHEVFLAENGYEALKIASQCHPDVIISDISMPKMGGLELAKSIREIDEFANTPLVALTGYGQNEDRERALQSGFDYHLVKPVDIAQLRQVYSELTESFALRRD